MGADVPSILIPQLSWLTICRDMVMCVPRVSVCELEADGLAADVLNREELSMGEVVSTSQ